MMVMTINNDVHDGCNDDDDDDHYDNDNDKN